jgi:hypothetical protein
MREKRPASKTRTVMYAFESNSKGPALLDCERVLAKAKAAGIVTNYDDGRDNWPWFEAPPGASARELRDKFLQAGYTIRRL